MILVGNKCDLENKREVDTGVGKATAKNWDIPFLETSAKKDLNIQVRIARWALAIAGLYPH